MQQLFELLTKIDTNQKTRIKSERADIIRQFLEEINKERPCKYKVGNKIKTLDKMTARGVALKLGHLKDNGTLYYFLSECKDYKNRNGSFSKFFFGALKVK